MLCISRSTSQEPHSWTVLFGELEPPRKEKKWERRWCTALQLQGRTGNKARHRVCHLGTRLGVGVLSDLLKLSSKVQCILPQFFHVALMNLHCTQLLVNSATCVGERLREIRRGRNGGNYKARQVLGDSDGWLNIFLNIHHKQCTCFTMHTCQLRVSVQKLLMYTVHMHC